MTPKIKQPAPDVHDIVVAASKAIYDGSDEEYDALDDEDRAQFMSAALRVLLLHDEWLKTMGFKVLPPNTVQSPVNELEAVTMLRASQQWLEKHPPKKKLIIPNAFVAGRTQ